MKVRDIMTTDVRACDPAASLAEAAMIMWDNDCGVVPLVNDAGQVAGIITDRDICMALVMKNRLASDITAGEIGVRPVRFCTPDADVRAALDVMRREQLHRLPVIGEGGALVGILSLADVIRHAKKGESKKARHVPHKDVIRVLKALTRPASPLDDDLPASADDDDETATERDASDDATPAALDV
jgi:CBS domain-containing protein